MEQNNAKANLSELDRVFIPKDLDDNVTIYDLASYSNISVKFWRTVPANYSLVTKNVLSQNVDFRDGSGIKLINPLFTKTILVPLMDATHGYNNLSVTTLDGVEIKTDIKLVMRITDPAMYVTEGKYQIEQLNSLVKRLLRIYISSKNFSNVIQEQCDMNKFDLNNEFGLFEDKYGIKIDRVIIEKVELPENLKRQYNDAAEARERQKALDIENETRKKKSLADAEIRENDAKAKAKEIKILEEAKTQAYIDKMIKLVDSLKKQGVSTNSIEEYIRTLIVAEKGNAIFMNAGGGANSSANDIANGVAAGIKAAEMKKDNDVVGGKQLTNVDKLINLLETYSVMLDGNDNEYYNNMYKMLQNDVNTREKINRLSEDEYLTFINNVFGNIDYTNISTNSKKRK